MRELTRPEIETLANRKGVRKFAVENFLSTMGGSTQGEALSNLSADARSYGWNAPTQNAIRTGIMAAAGKHTIRVKEPHA